MPHVRSLAFRILIGAVPLLLNSGGAFGGESSLPAGALIEDPAGRGLAGVEVFVFPADPRESGGLLGVLRSDPNGRLPLDGLSPGVYLLALNKPGYQIVLARLNTRFLSLLRLRLPPESMPSVPASATRPESMDWVLRLERSDALKEIGPAEPGPPAASGAATPPSGRSDIPAGPVPDPVAARIPFRADLSQSFSGRPPLGSAGNPDSSGRETALQFLGDLPGRGSWEVRGRARNLNTGPGDSARAMEGEDQGASLVRIGVQYDLNPGGSIAMAARYDRDRFSSDTSPVPIPSRQEVRTFGYEALWSRRLAGGEDLEMGLGFVEAEGTLPALENASDGGASTGPPDPLKDRRWNAGARFAMHPAPDHRVSISGGMNVYRQDVAPEGWILAPVQGGMGLNELARRGWTLSLSGEDAWRISPPLSLQFAVDCHVSEVEGRSSIFLPRLGARHEGKRTMIQGALIVRADAGAEGNPNGGADSGSSPGREASVGYRAEIEHRLDGSWILGGHLERSPFYAGSPPAAPAEPAGAEPPGGLWIDPAASADEVGILVRKRLGGLDGRLESDHGRIRGRVGGDGSEAPILSLETGEVQYLAVKASASVEKSQTRVHLDYRRYDGSDSLAQAGGPARLSRMNLVVHQPLPFLRRSTPADWRLLFGYQDLTREANGDLAPGGPAPLDRVRRLSGGVGVRF